MAVARNITRHIDVRYTSQRWVGCLLSYSDMSASRNMLLI